ncbi:uncharacterized protein [Prorops nasuta]|uniref:uncharacterized protein isoform X2 n=1 Tax=Prorops nasuta TaxID=863751 RepID=UPI0034CE551D
MDKYVMVSYLLFTILISFIIADPYVVLISKKDQSTLCQGALFTPKHIITASVCVCYGENTNPVNVISFDTKLNKSKLNDVANVHCESVGLEKNETVRHIGHEIAIIELKEEMQLPIKVAGSFPSTKSVLLYSTVKNMFNGVDVKLRTVPFVVYGTESCKQYGIVTAPHNRVCGRANVYRAPMPYLGSAVIDNYDRLVGIIYEIQNDFTDLSRILLSYNDLTRPNEFIKSVLKQDYSKFFRNDYKPLHIRPAAEVSFQPDVQLSRLRRDPSHEPYLAHITLAHDKSIKCFGVLITSEHVLVPADCVCDKRDSPESFDVYGALSVIGSLASKNKPREIFCGVDYEGIDFNFDIKRTAILELQSLTYDPIEIDTTFPKEDDPIFYTISTIVGYSPMKDMKFRAKITSFCADLKLTPGRNNCIYTAYKEPIMGVPIVSLSEKLVGMVYHVGPSEDHRNVFTYIDVTNTIPFVKSNIEEAYFERFKPETSDLTHRDFAASYHWASLEQTKNLYDSPGDRSYLVLIRTKSKYACNGVLITESHVLTSQCACDSEPSDIIVEQLEFFANKQYFQYRPIMVNCFKEQKTAILHLDVALETPIRLIEYFPKPLERVYYTVYDVRKSVIVRVLATVEKNHHCVRDVLIFDLNKFSCGKVIKNNPDREPVIGTPVLSMDNKLIGTVFFNGINPNKRIIFFFTDVTYIYNNLRNIINPKMFKVISPLTEALKESKFSADLALPREINVNLYDFSDDLPYLVFIRDKTEKIICPGTMITNTHVLTLADCVCKIPYTELTLISFEYYKFGDKYVYYPGNVYCEPALKGQPNANYLSAILILATNTFDPVRLAVASPTTYAMYYTVFDKGTKNITKILFFVEDKIFCKTTQLQFYPGISTCGRLIVDHIDKQPSLGTPVISITNELIGLIFDIKTMENGRTVFTYTDIIATRPFLDSEIDKRLYRSSLAYNRPLYEKSFAADVALKPVQTTNLYDKRHDSPYLVFIRDKASREILGAGALITNGHVLTAYSVVCQQKDLQTIEVLTERTYKYFEPLSVDIKTVHCEDSKKYVIERSAIIELLFSTDTPVQVMDESVNLPLHEYIHYTIFDNTTHKITKVLSLHEDQEYCNSYRLQRSPSSVGCGKILKSYKLIDPIIGTPVLTIDNKLIGVVYEIKKNKNGAVFAYTNVIQSRLFLNEHINRKWYKVAKAENITVSGTRFSADIPLHKRKVKVDNPFLVLLKPRHSNVPHCAGALITSTHILTLARCVCKQADNLVEIHTSSTYLFHKTPVLYSKEVTCEPDNDSDINAMAKIAILKIETPRHSPIEMSFMHSKSGSISYIVPFNREQKFFVRSLPALRAFQADCMKDEVHAFNNTNNCLKIIWDDGSELYHGSPVINNNKLIGLVYDFPTKAHNGSTFAYIDLIYVQKFMFDEITEEELSTFLDFDDEDDDLLAIDGFTSSRIDVFSRPTKLFAFAYYNAMYFSYLVLIYKDNVLIESCHGVYISFKHVMTAAECICLDLDDPNIKIQLDESLTVMPEGTSRIHLAHRAFVPTFDNTTVYYLCPSRTNEGLVYEIQVTTALIVNEQECIDNKISVSESEKLCARTFNDKRKPVLGSPLLTEDNDVFGVINSVTKGINSDVFYIGYIHINNNIKFINRALASI